MSSYLGNIVQYIRGVNALSFKNSIYMGNDINAIDTAYSETENHKLSVFFVPGDTTTSSDAGTLLETNYFKAYIFVPVEEDVAATDGWEEAINAGNTMTRYLTGTTAGVNKLRYLGGREFRVGRGYYIYVLSYSIDTVPGGGFSGGRQITYFVYAGETDGTATYTRKWIDNCAVDENYSLSRVVAGTYRSFGCEVLVGPQVGFGLNLTPTYKDWFVIGSAPNNINSKADAVAAGLKVYEVNQWKEFFGEINNVWLGMRIVGA